MIYFCADDYGLDNLSSMRIEECLQKGALNKVSVFPNFSKVDLQKLEKVRLSLHLNLVEGRCLAPIEEVGLLVDNKGNLKHTFTGLLKLSLLHKNEFEMQLYKEIRAQVSAYKNLLPNDAPFCIDSHQHTHMIPAVFRTLIKVLRDEEIKVEYMRIPSEPILPFLKTPSLYFTYSAVNVIKQLLLKFFWFINKKTAKDLSFSTALFFGILFSGKMDEKRVKKILPKYIKLANKEQKDIEVLFHPGYLSDNEADFKDKNIAFCEFYFSKNRKTEFDSVMNIEERSVR